MILVPYLQFPGILLLQEHIASNIILTGATSSSSSLPMLTPADSSILLFVRGSIGVVDFLFTHNLRVLLSALDTIQFIAHCLTSPYSHHHLNSPHPLQMLNWTSLKYPWQYASPFKSAVYKKNLQLDHLMFASLWNLIIRDSCSLIGILRTWQYAA